MKHVHMIGIGGSGLSAIALFLKERGYMVTGSDRSLSPLARQLSALGVIVYAGHDPRQVQGAELVIRSSAVQDDNPEVVAALAAGIPVLKRQDILADLMAGKYGIAIGGTHGKTTTTAMLAWVLTCLKEDPSYIIGGLSKNLGVNAHAGQGSCFIVEADEYDHMFLGLRPQVIILTNVEHDHPDLFPTVEDYQVAFKHFVELLPQDGKLFYCADDSGIRHLVNDLAGKNFFSFSYGTGQTADYPILDLSTNSFGGCDFRFAINQPGGEPVAMTKVSLQVPGVHNALNATAVMAVVHQLGLSLSAAAEALAQFIGTGRRFDLLGEAGGISVIDDYAHHPTEVNATLAAARARYPGRRLWAVWQPHTYSRTLTLLDGFTHAFRHADEVIVTEVYAARERNEAFSAAQVAARLDHPSVHFSPNFGEASVYLLEHLRPDDVVLVLSAGDADQISSAVLAGLKQKEQDNA